MAAILSIADSRVPDWIERNAQLFRRPREATTSNIRASLIKLDSDDGGEEEEYAAACMTAMLINTEKGLGWIEVPTPNNQLPASYFRDVSNHSNILATFVYSARVKAGFIPGYVDGQQLSLEQWDDFINKFNALLNELDAFWFYITLSKHEAESISNLPATSDAIVGALSKFVLNTTVEIDDEAKEELTQRIKTTFELASEYMVEKNIKDDSTTVVKVAFQHEAFPAIGPSNPIVAISFTRTTLSKNEQNSIKYGATTMNRFIFKLNSAAIIANAEALSRNSTIVSTKAYTDFINEPLDNWAQDGGVAPVTN